jgi:hypothetical protein
MENLGTYMNDPFIQNFLSNLFATLIALIIGIPIALWLERKRAAKERSSKKEEESRRTQKILQLIGTELQEDRAAVSQLHANPIHFHQPIKTELWDAFSDGGELQFINDPDLLASLSSAYSAIRHAKFLYDKYFDLYVFSVPKPDLSLRDPLFDEVLRVASECGRTINKVLEKVNEKLASFKVPRVSQPPTSGTV